MRSASKVEYYLAMEELQVKPFVENIESFKIYDTQRLQLWEKKLNPQNGLRIFLDEQVWRCYQIPGWNTLMSFKSFKSAPISQFECTQGKRGYNCDMVFNAPLVSCQSSSLQPEFQK